MNDCKNCKYTDEYCASGDCNKTQVNNIACNKISLTEKWKKDELPSGMYYIEFKDGDISKDVYTFGSWGNINEHFLKQVLAEVPSYDEWKAKLEENAQLKELLKQAETQIIAYKNNDTLPERAFYEKEVEELLGKIDEVQK